MLTAAKFLILSLLLITSLELMAQNNKQVRIELPPNAAPRIKFGAAKLQSALIKKGYLVVQKNFKYNIQLLEWNNNIPLLKNLPKPKKEGFLIKTISPGKIIIAAADPSGLLYGCQELSKQIEETGNIASNYNYHDQPEMVLRGTCIGLQKPYYLPGRTVYEYPYTPQTFPWFYDKKLWIRCLDSLAENRMNALFLWNGHPFASLVRLKDYPYAVEVDDESFRKNEEIYKFLTSEADKRGIWVIQMFYNIIVSKPFAEKHNIKTQDRERPIIPLISDYTRKSISAFVAKYPNVGLMVCLGEAMEGTGQDDIDWFTKTIIPGVRDGLKEINSSEEPPIVLRAHDTDAPSVMKAALSLYKNLYTEAKFNGEALTTYEPRGQWAELHRTLSRIGTVQIENVHILANLEPFRYGATDFIQRSVQGMHTIMEGNGLHLYPQASYWDWPYTADSVKGEKLLQIERDWIWYKAWSRYAWKSDRKKENEIDYWALQLSNRYGCSLNEGKNILRAYEESGLIAPKLLRRFGITDGNRQTLTLGMLMTQLINPFRFGLFTLLYESESPEGEMLIDYAEKEWKGLPHVGETPVQIINEVVAHGQAAVTAIESAKPSIKKNKEEYLRLLNDMYCYRALANHFATKTAAALWVIRFKYSNDVNDLEKALPLLKKSLEHYRELVDLTTTTYRYANSMQTQQRKIPLRGFDGTFKTWKEVYGPFQLELKVFMHRLDSLKNLKPSAKTERTRLTNENVVIDPSLPIFSLDSGAHIFTDSLAIIEKLAPEIKGLKGFQLSHHKQVAEGTTISFSTKKPVKLLVGYFVVKAGAFAGPTVYLKPPELETNASANEFGQSETKIANAIVVKGMPPVNIHSYSFGAGNHTLKLARGVCMVIGFIPGNQFIPVYDAGLTAAGVKREVDWLFE